MTESTPNVGKWRAIPREPRLIEAHATVLVCDDFGVDARLVLDGDFASDGERDAYVKQLLARLNEPSPKRREAIEADMWRGSRLTTHRLAVGNFGKPQTPPAQSPTPAVDDVKEPSPFYAAPQASADAAGQPMSLPELNDDLIDILGRPNFTCIRIAQLLRLSGVDIAAKAEAEQATVIHYLLGFYLKHGSLWAEKVDEDLKQRRDAAIAAKQGKGGAA